MLLLLTPAKGWKDTKPNIQGDTKHWTLLVKKMRHVSQGTAATRLRRGWDSQRRPRYKFTAQQ